MFSFDTSCRPREQTSLSVNVSCAGLNVISEISENALPWPSSSPAGGEATLVALGWKASESIATQNLEHEELLMDANPEKSFSGLCLIKKNIFSTLFAWRKKSSNFRFQYFECFLTYKSIFFATNFSSRWESMEETIHLILGFLYLLKHHDMTLVLRKQTLQKYLSF